MRKIFKFVAITSILALVGFWVPKTFSQTTDDLKDKVDELKDKINGIDERLLTDESDLSKLTKIKLSGYIQAQWEHYDIPSAYPANTFYLRRVRLKTTYEAADGVKFVFQPDFSNITAPVVKDAYVQLNDHWLGVFSLWMGQFNRPNYEVEYSSSQREVPERSKMILALYPGERAMGAKLEYQPKTIPLKIQLALLNGNDYQTYNAALNNPTNGKDLDNFKDIMARATYNFKFGDFGGLDVGAHAYFGGVKAFTDTTLKGDYTKDGYIKIGDPLKRSWFGAEFQFYADVLGGMALKGEYITGTNVTPGYLTTTSATSSSTTLKNDTLWTTSTVTNTNARTPNLSAKFSGYYLYFIKNIGKKHQFALRYDVYDPNADIAGTDIGVKKYSNSATTSSTKTTVSGNNVTTTTTKTVNSTSLSSGKSDLAYSTLTLAWHWYFDDNIRITFAYAMPVNEKVGTKSDGTGNIIDHPVVNNITKTIDYSKVFPQNTFTLRIQAKF